MRAASVSTLAKFGDERAVPGLIGSLRDSDADIRKASAEALGSIGGQGAVPRLIDSLEDPETRVRMAATRTLVQLDLKEHREEAVTALIEVMRNDRGLIFDDELDELRAEAATALGKLGDRRAVPALMEAIRDRHRDGLVLNALRALGDIADPRTAPEIIEFVEERFSRIGLTGTRVLGKLGDPQAGDLLIDALYRSRNYGPSSQADLVEAASEALGNLGIVRAIPHLLAQLHRTEYTEVVTVVKALRQLGDTLAMQVLFEMLESPASDVAQQIEAARALGGLEDQAAVPPLIRALEDENAQVRRSAAYALRNLKAPEAFHPLVDLLDDDEEGVRAAALSALGGLGDQRAVPLLMRALEDEGPETRGAAARALGQMGVVEAYESFIDMLGDEDGRLRMAAAFALGQIDDQRAVPHLVDALERENRSPGVHQQVRQALESLRET